MAGNFVVGQALATMTDQSFLIDVHVWLQDYTCRHQFAPLRIRNSEHGYLANGRMVQNDGFDLAAIDILATGDEHVFQPVKDVEVSVGVLVTDISCAKEAVSKGNRRVLQVVPVAA